MDKMTMRAFTGFVGAIVASSGYAFGVDMWTESKQIKEAFHGYTEEMHASLTNVSMGQFAIDEKTTWAQALDYIIQALNKKKNRFRTIVVFCNSSDQRDMKHALNSTMLAAPRFAGNTSNAIKRIKVMTGADLLSILRSELTISRIMSVDQVIVFSP